MPQHQQEALFLAYWFMYSPEARFTLGDREVRCISINSSAGAVAGRVMTLRLHVSILNVVIFGETGVGKSPLINLIPGLHQAKTSPDTGKYPISIVACADTRLIDCIGGDQADVDAQGKLAEGAVVTLVILSSDKTSLSVFSRDKKAWPVYLTIGNISKDIQR